MAINETNSLDSRLPFTISVLESCDFRVNWHNYIELIYCIKGHVSIRVNDSTESIGPDDFFLLNRYDIHELISMTQDALLLVIRFEPEFYAMYYPDLNKMRFENHPYQSMDTLNLMDDIKASISKLMATRYESSETAQLKLVSTSIEVFEKTISIFKKTSEASHEGETGSKDRLTRLIRYIDAHSSDSISLNQMAAQEYVTPHYLSKYFKIHMGMTFSAYLSQVRLHKSMPTLMGTNESILNIALSHGFPNAKSYSQAFKSHYGTTPHAFRKDYKSASPHPLNEGDSISSQNEETIISFIEKHQRFESVAAKAKNVHKSIDLRRCKPQPIHFNRVIYFDFVYDGLNSNWQNTLQQAQKSLGFEYIKFKGIFTSGMYFFDPENNWYNWFNVDNLLDFFIQQNLKPFIELTFKPSDHTLTEWHTLLESFLSHCLERYGADELNTWNFEIASEDRSYESAIKLYTKTLKVLKKKYSNLRLGILFIPADDFEERDYLINFRDKDLRFMSVQISEETYNKKTALCQELLYNIRIGMGLETYVIFTHKSNYWNDTCYMSTKTAQEILDNYTVNSLIPFMDNIRSKMMFQGNDALLTYNGLHKPMFNAALLLGKMNGKLVDKDENHFIVKRPSGDYAILIFAHFETHGHASLPEPAGHMKYMQTNRKQQYKNSLHISFDLSLDSGRYEQRTYSLNSENGSIFDGWINMGAPDTLSRDDLEILKAKEKMHLHISQKFIQDNYKFNTVIRPGEIRLIELKLI